MEHGERRRGGSFSALALGVCGLVLFAAGALAGVWFFAPSRAPHGSVSAAPGAGGVSVEVGAALARLEAQVQELRGELADRPVSSGLRVPGRSEGGGVQPAALQDLRAELLAEVREASARVPVGGEVGSAAAIEERLQAIENLVRGRMLILDRSGSGGSSLRVPRIEPDRAALTALQIQRESDGGSEAVEAAHRMWTYQQVLDRYGPPDEVSPADDYLEWIYYLPEYGDNFDFHFVDGMCVLAH